MASVQHHISSEKHQGTRPRTSSLSFSKLAESIPQELRKVSGRRGLRNIAAVVSLCLLGLTFLYLSPWWLLPLAWIFMGTVATGLQAIGYDIATGLFSRHVVMNEIIGHLVTLPLLVPFESWKLQLQNQEYEKLCAKIASTPFWWLSSIVQWLKCNFAWGRVFQRNQAAVVSSVLVMYAGVALVFGSITYLFGAWTLAKYWFAPWCVYHFWMTTFITTSYKQREGKAAEKLMVVHIRYPQWVELLTNNMNYIMSAHRSSLRVPSYNLKQSYQSLRDKCGSYMQELSFRSDFLASMAQSFEWWASVAKNFNYLAGSFILITPVLALYGALTTEWQAATVKVAIIVYFVAGLGITVGYHRLFSHRSFDGHPIFRVLVMLSASAAFEGSCLWWCTGHRAHHRFSDTPKDPYGVDRGFWWAHMGWLLMKLDKTKVGKTDITDLENDKLVMWQERNYKWLSVVFGMLIPLAICGFGWGDWRGGFFIAGMVRIVFVMQTTFCINSLAHYWGDQLFSDNRSSRDNPFVSLLTLGEGYHNFHHEYPADYRNGLVWWTYDPSKWTIWLMSWVGLTYNLRRFPKDEIDKCILQMQEKRISQKKANLNYGPDIPTLPVYTWSEIKEHVREGASLIVISEVVYDVTEFKKVHPGGEKMISIRMGEDCTEAFNGTIYNHGWGARHWLKMLAVGRMKPVEKEL